jgi:hypothetical protein
MGQPLPVFLLPGQKGYSPGAAEQRFRSESGGEGIIWQQENVNARADKVASIEGRIRRVGLAPGALASLALPAHYLLQGRATQRGAQGTVGL